MIRSSNEEQGLSLSASQDLVARIPNARFTLIDTPNLFLLTSESTAYVDAITGFLDEDHGAEKATLPSGTAIILFLDIADSTALTERMGDVPFRDAARALDERLRTAIRENGGTAIEGEVLGDGVMAVFRCAREAMRRRPSLQRRERRLSLHLRNTPATLWQRAQQRLRRRGQTWHQGLGLQLPGGSTFLDTVRALARTSTNVNFGARRAPTSRATTEPVRVLAVAGSPVPQVQPGAPLDRGGRCVVHDSSDEQAQAGEALRHCACGSGPRYARAERRAEAVHGCCGLQRQVQVVVARDVEDLGRLEVLGVGFAAPMADHRVALWDGDAVEVRVLHRNSSRRPRRAGSRSEGPPPWPRI